ncbi:MAG TPA: lipopolysaccharide biosynthesis protein [Verrucomicrobiae bacterium]|nr:lipopolysaccharide biosynthesis protein [Verrucomicrobiae bacterium]
MSSTLKKKALGAVVWSAAEQFTTQGVGFVIGIFLARLLQPQQFGLLGMIGVFLGLGQVFASCGFGQALIQRQDTTRVDESSVFYVNVFLGVIASVSLFLAAPGIAAFYKQSSLELLTKIMAVDVLINSFGVVQVALLTKRMDFKTQLKISVTANAVSGIIAIIMAVRGMGVISLVSQLLIRDTLRTVLVWRMDDWRPLAALSLKSVRRLFSFGSRIFASALVNAAFQSLYPLTIGKLFSPASLGYFTRAQQLQSAPAENLINTVARVSFPLFSALQHDPAKLKRAVRRAVILMVFLVFPLMTGLACVADSLVRVLLTDKWRPCVPLLQIFCLAGALYPLQTIHTYALMALGRADLFFRLEVAKKVLGVTAIALTYRFGVTGLVWGDALTTLLCFFITGYCIVRFISYPWREQIRDLLPYFVLSVSMAIPVIGVKMLGIGNSIAVLLLQITVGIAAYAVGGIVFRVSALADAWEFLQQRGFPFARSAPVVPESTTD